MGSPPRAPDCQEAAPGEKCCHLHIKQLSSCSSHDYSSRACYVSGLNFYGAKNVLPFFQAFFSLFFWLNLCLIINEHVVYFLHFRSHLNNVTICEDQIIFCVLWHVQTFQQRKRVLPSFTVGCKFPSLTNWKKHNGNILMFINLIFYECFLCTSIYKWFPVHCNANQTLQRSSQEFCTNTSSTCPYRSWATDRQRLSNVFTPDFLFFYI